MFNSLTFLDLKCRLDIPKARGRRLDDGGFMGDLSSPHFFIYLMFYFALSRFNSHAFQC
jgi:hypothetical protein